MNDFQTKVGGSLNMIQGTIQQGKQKIQTVQERSQIEQALNGFRQKRQELILLLGNNAHKKVRLKEINDIDFTKVSKDIESLDKQIYQHAKAIDELKQESGSFYSCSSCNSEVALTDKFCGSCGAPVSIPETLPESTKVCGNCEENIPSIASFCPCCGYAVSIVQGDSNVL